MSDKDKRDWNGSEANVYAKLIESNFDMTDVDAENKKNFLHYALSKDNTYNFRETIFKMQTMPKELLGNLMNQKDIYGNKHFN